MKRLQACVRRMPIFVIGLLAACAEQPTEECNPMYIRIVHEEVPVVRIMRGGGYVEWTEIRAKVECDWALYKKENPDYDIPREEIR